MVVGNPESDFRLSLDDVEAALTGQRRRLAAAGGRFCVERAVGETTQPRQVRRRLR
jgi:hypothetical protein